MSPTHPKRLKLHRETLRQLDSTALSRANGGASWSLQEISCILSYYSRCDQCGPNPASILYCEDTVWACVGGK